MGDGQRARDFTGEEALIYAGPCHGKLISHQSHLSSIFSTQLISKSIFVCIQDKNSICHTTLGQNCC